MSAQPQQKVDLNRLMQMRISNDTIKTGIENWKVRIDKKMLAYAVAYKNKDSDAKDKLEKELYDDYATYAHSQMMLQECEVDIETYIDKFGSDHPNSTFEELTEELIQKLIRETPVELIQQMTVESEDKK